MGSLSEFRHNAEQCARLAAVASRDTDRLVLLELAQSWLWLAELAQKANADEGWNVRRSSARALLPEDA
jgi:hypothetical protein